MKRILVGLAAALCLLIAVLVVRTLQFVPPEQAVGNSLVEVEWQAEPLVGGLAAALRYPTISYDDPQKVDQQAFADFHDFLRQRFPQVFETLSVQRFDNSLLLHWALLSHVKHGDCVSNKCSSQ